ncbi:MAG: ABC transporter permease subunit [Planctomycetota bacterium]
MLFRYVVRRLLGSLVVMWIIITASFLLVRAVPGNPFAKDRQASDSSMRDQLARYHLDKPILPVYVMPTDEAVAERRALPITWSKDEGPPSEVAIGSLRIMVNPLEWGRTQYVSYLGGLLGGDFGKSFQQERSVGEILFGDAVRFSVLLGCCALVVALLIGIPAGLIAGLRQNRWQDYTAMGGAMIGVSIPNFVLGPLLIIIFALNLRWFHAGGYQGITDLVLPALALGLYFAAYIARLARAGTLEVVRQDYIRTARAKGLPERLVLLRHTLKGAMLPVVSYLGPAFAAMLTGSVVVERVFSLPGVGTYFVNAALSRDYNLVLGTVILYSMLLVALNVVVDVLYTFLDPRVRYDKAANTPPLKIRRTLGIVLGIAVVLGTVGTVPAFWLGAVALLAIALLGFVIMQFGVPLRLACWLGVMTLLGVVFSTTGVPFGGALWIALVPVVWWLLGKVLPAPPEIAGLEKGTSLWRDAGRRLLKNRAAMAGAFVLLVMATVALDAGSLTRYVTHFTYNETHNTGVQIRPPGARSVPTDFTRFLPIADHGFEAVDTNRDGRIDASELSAAVSRLEFARHDSDHNGQLSEAEFNAAPHGVLGMIATHARQDLDGNGSLSLDETLDWTEIFPSRDAATLIRRYDTHGAEGSTEPDGRLSPDEFPGLPEPELHLLGTDANGRDLFTRLVWGGRISLMVGIAATLVSFLIGVTWGAVAGFIGGRLDSVMMRFVDVMYGLPFMFLVILLMSVFGQDLLLIFLALGAVQWLTMSRIVRGQVISLKQREFVLAAESIGVSKLTIIFRHLVPNALGPIIVYSTLLVPAVMLEEAFLSFLGLGVAPPDASWGSLANEGRSSLDTRPWLILWPGIALAITLLSFNFLGDGLRDALDPQMKKD